jgi:antirestriction protein ArdC
MNSYQQITDQIIANLENAKGWSDMISFGNRPINIIGRPYQGVNLMLLYKPEYKSRIWGTFNQIIKHGGKIRKGEKSSMVAFWSKYQPKPTAEGKKPEEKWFLKIYRVFNVEQCEFIDGNEYLESLEGKLNEDPIPAAPDEVVSDYLKRENIALQRIVRHSVPFYSPKKDLISITDHALYENNEEYLMTLFHELIRSTGHPKRLKRCEVGSSIFGSQEYSLEELVAEIGANFLSAETDVKPDFLNSVGYIKGWIPKLKEHPRWIVSAAAKAEKATEFILGGGAE